MSHALKAQFLEKYARFCWPLHRKVGAKVAERCSRCGLSENASPLHNRVCGECLASSDEPDMEKADSVNAELAGQFDELMKSAGGQGSGAYDLLLLFSGGKDSAWLMHHLRTGYPKIRILALLVDNGFLSPVARSNAENMVAALGVDYQLFRPEPDVFRKPLRQAFTYAMEHGCSGTVDRVDGHLLHDIGRHIAAERSIPYLMSGVSWAQVEDIFGVRHFEMPREKERTLRTHAGPFVFRDHLTESELRYFWNPDLYPEERIARFLFPFYAWRRSEEDLINEVVSLGLIKKRNVSPLVTNNALITLMCVVDVLHLGYSSYEPEFCKMIREGKASLTFWSNLFSLLEHCSKTGFLIKPDVRDALERLEINPQDLHIDWLS